MTLSTPKTYKISSLSHNQTTGCSENRQDCATLPPSQPDMKNCEKNNEENEDHEGNFKTGRDSERQLVKPEVCEN